MKRSSVVKAIGHSSRRAALLALGLSMLSGHAQTSVTVHSESGFEFNLGEAIPSADPPSASDEDLPTPPTGPGTTNAPAQAKSPEAQRLQALLKLKFDRSPNAILKGLAAQFNPTNASTNAVEQFKQDVILGDWKKAGAFLGMLPPEHGKQVYRHLLKELASSARPGNQPGGEMQPQMMEDGAMIMMNQGQQGPANNAAPALVADDVMALAEIAPHELTEDDAKSLGQLLAKLAPRGDAIEPFVSRLEKGVKRLGGADPEDRKRAAELLLAANRRAEAVAFFPALDVAKAQLNWRALDQSARDLAARGKQEKDSKLLVQAWDLNQFIIGNTNAGATNRDPALQRCLELLPQLSRHVGTNWLRERFQAEPAQGLGIFAVLNQAVQKGLATHNAETRQRNLEAQREAVDIFLAVGNPALPHWHASLQLLAQGWVQEANWAKQRYRPPQNYGAQYDQFGNMVGFENYQQNFFDGNQIPPLTPEQVLAAAPTEAWLAQLDAGLRVAVMRLKAELYCKTETPDKALPSIEAVAAIQPRVATDLANSFLRAWAEARNPNQNQQNQSRYYMNGVMYYGSNPYGQQRNGISLTRAMQVRNIKELAGLLKRFEIVSLAKLEDDALVAAFAAAHSPAEVFKVADIETVFGPRNKIKADTQAGLAQTMRERLAQQWRQPRVQQDAKTQRNDKQIEAEVLRGYEVVLELIADALKVEPANWRLHVARASTLFDLAEFQYGKKVDLAIYVEKRDECFKEFERAAQLYANALATTEEKDETPFVYQQWFNANLGASDLAYVTRQQEPETNQLAHVKNAILALPGGAADRHLAAFAKQLGQSANQLRPELKPRFLRAGLSIVGIHPAAEEARKLVAYYDDLLQELDLVARVDGDATVGHGQPFGVFISLRHTADIEREAGGFGRYLRNTKGQSAYYYNSYGGQQRNFPEEFEKQVREKLAEHYEVKTVTFLDEKVKSRGYGRTGWRETPLAYLLVQAKDGSVDQLPEFHMDLDFSDARGQVVLPVKSPVVLLDARPERVTARPVENLEIVQTLDDREIAAGKVTLEIKASGNGLVPPLPELLRTNFAHLRVTEFVDRGVALNRIDADADLLAPVSERNWAIKFAVTEDAPAALEFKFPEPLRPEAKLTYKRYADADIVEVKPTLALAGVSLRPRPWWHWAAGGIVGIGLIAAAAWLFRRKVHPTETAPPTYLLPAQLTPFVLIDLLRRMNADRNLPLGESHRTELGVTIRELEEHYFARRKNGQADPDLAGIGQQWVSRATNGK